MSTDVRSCAVSVPAGAEENSVKRQNNNKRQPTRQHKDINSRYTQRACLAKIAPVKHTAHPALCDQAHSKRCVHALALQHAGGCNYIVPAIVLDESKCYNLTREVASHEESTGREADEVSI